MRLGRRRLLRALGGGAVVGSAGATAQSSASFGPLGSLALPGAAEVVVGEDGRVAYVATGDGFATVDLSDPTAPSVLAERTDVAADHEDGPLRSVLDVAVDGDRLLVSGPAQRGRLRGLQLYDVSDPAAPEPATDFARTAHRVHNADLADGYAYLTNNRPPERPLTIYDVTGEGTAPREVARWSPLSYDADVEGWSGLPVFPGVLHDVTVRDGVAYCAYWDGGTWMVDVSDPTAPSYLGYVGDYPLSRLVDLAADFAAGETTEYQRLFREAPGNDHYVTVDDDAAVLAVGGEAWDDPSTPGGGPADLDLYDVSDPSNPVQTATIAPEPAADTTRGGTWVTPHNFAIRDDRLYSAWYDAGVKIHDISDPSDPERLAWWLQPESARFWTAQVARPGETFVATSYGTDGRESALYVFPDRAGTQPDHPSLGAPTATRTTEATRTTATTTETATPERTPGFGVVAAFIGLGYGAYRALGRDEK